MMEAKELKRGKDGYIDAEVRDGNDYLSYFYRPTKGWVACFGIVDNRDVKGDSWSMRRLSWMGSGRGRISEKTWDKIHNMQKYFLENSPK